MIRMQDVAALKKALINAASSGMPHPEEGTSAGDALRRFVDPNSAEFDQDFVDDLRNVDEDWMVSQAGPTFH